MATIKDVFVVPQRPYMPMFASLADLVTYPEKIDTSKPENCELDIVEQFFDKEPSNQSSMSLKMDAKLLYATLGPSRS